MKIGIFIDSVCGPNHHLYNLKGCFKAKFKPFPKVKRTSEFGNFDVIIIANNPWGSMKEEYINDTHNVILIMSEPVRPIIKADIALCNFAGAAFFNKYYSWIPKYIDNFHFVVKENMMPTDEMMAKILYSPGKYEPNSQNFNYDYFLKKQNEILKAYRSQYTQIDYTPEEYLGGVRCFKGSFCPVRNEGYLTARIFEALAMGSVPYIYIENRAAYKMLEWKGFKHRVNCFIITRPGIDLPEPTDQMVLAARNLYFNQFLPSKMAKFLLDYGRLLIGAKKQNN